jgi:exopolyphosphatase/guanosine-5'-triphosphate,3'-diphosphate pyrophosphatase
VDFFNRHQHTADIIVATELDGFSHREIALVSAIVRLAGDEDASLKPYAPLLTAGDRRALERAGVLLALADDIEERCARGDQIGLSCRLTAKEARVGVQGLAGWRPRAITERFERSFGRTLVVEPA